MEARQVLVSYQHNQTGLSLTGLPLPFVQTGGSSSNGGGGVVGAGGGALFPFPLIFVPTGGVCE